MSGVVEEIVANAVFWPGVYFCAGGVIRYTSLHKLRQGTSMRQIPGYTHLKEPMPRDEWLKEVAPRHVLKARLWWAWPLALKRINETDIATVESEIGQATLERMKKERDELERKLDVEKRRNEEQRMTEWMSNRVKPRAELRASISHFAEPDGPLYEPEPDAFQDALQRSYVRKEDALRQADRDGKPIC